MFFSNVLLVWEKCYLYRIGTWKNYQQEYWKEILYGGKFRFNDNWNSSAGMGNILEESLLWFIVFRWVASSRKDTIQPDKTSIHQVLFMETKRYSYWILVMFTDPDSIEVTCRVLGLDKRFVGNAWLHTCILNIKSIKFLYNKKTLFSAQNM